MFFSISKLILLIIALSADAFTAGFAYGADNVKIPPLSAVIVAMLSDLLLISSLFIGNLFKAYIPASIASFLSFVILFVLAAVKIFDSSLKKTIQDANCDDVSILSPTEALSLGFALSADSAAAGIGAASLEFSLPLTAVLTFLIGMIAVCGGCRLGRLLASKSDFNFSIIGGFLLLFLAFTKLLP